MRLRINNNPSGFRMMILLLILAGAAALTINPVSANGEVSFTARGDSSYYVGEEAIFIIPNNEPGSTYLFITGPNLPPGGGKLTSPYQPVVSGEPGSFTTVPPYPSFKSRDYFLYTSALGIGPGAYTIYAVSQPKTRAELAGVNYSTVDIILKKPFVTAGIVPSLVAKGQPFGITGFAEGDPENVLVWVFGDHYLMNAKIPVNPDSAYTFTVGPELFDKFPEGQLYLVVQHPMQNNKLNIVLEGDNIKTIVESPDGKRKEEGLFPIRGEGASQGWDAVQNYFDEFDRPWVDDTYIVIPFVVNNAGITPYIITEELGPARAVFSQMATPTVTTIAPATPVSSMTQPAPLLYAPVGAIVLIIGIAVWRKR